MIIERKKTLFSRDVAAQQMPASVGNETKSTKFKYKLQPSIYHSHTLAALMLRCSFWACQRTTVDSLLFLTLIQFPFSKFGNRQHNMTINNKRHKIKYIIHLWQETLTYINCRQAKQKNHANERTTLSTVGAAVKSFLINNNSSTKMWHLNRNGWIIQIR